MERRKQLTEQKDRLRGVPTETSNSLGVTLPHLKWRTLIRQNIQNFPIKVFHRAEESDFMPEGLGSQTAKVPQGTTAIAQRCLIF